MTAGWSNSRGPGLDSQRDEILRNYPWTKSLLSFVVRMAREPVRGAPRSVANLEFHRAGEEVNEVGAAIVAKLEERGIRAVNPSMGFPMEMYQSGGRRDLGGLAQARRRRGRAWPHGHSPQPDSSEIRQFRPAGHRADGAVKPATMTAPLTTTLASNASSAWLPVRSERLARKARSISLPVSRTTIASSWAAFPIGSSRSRMRAMRLTIAGASTTRKLRPCGKA